MVVDRISGKGKCKFIKPNVKVVLFMPILTMFAFCFSVFGMTVRSKSDMRLWQTVDNRAAPLEWPWADGADSAELVFAHNAQVDERFQTRDCISATRTVHNLV